jgi:hypothetical protein
MSADDPLDRVAQKVRDSKPQKKVARSTRTLMMAEPNFTTLQRYCQAKGVPVSDVINDLVEAFLEKVKDDLPPPK